MSDTPICDFVNGYVKKNAARFHMPGHKGKARLGSEAFDITEIDGADSLFEARGIIAESERIAGDIFGCPTFYSAEGSSLCIHAMLYLALLSAKNGSKKIAAARNVHKSFVSAAGLLGIDVDWIYPKSGDLYLSCTVTPRDVEEILSKGDDKPAAVYLTSPDYTGRIADIAGISEICKRRGVPLIVDNAHGAYLKFLSQSLFPIELGADMCCDSAHKTLPVLTGGAYLHISPEADKALLSRVKPAMSLFASTSPSYLILQSLDSANAYLRSFKEKLLKFIPEANELKSSLIAKGFRFFGDEPLKLTVLPKTYGYTGDALAAYLEKNGVVCEFHDPDLAVLMLSPENTARELNALKTALLSLPRKEPIKKTPPGMTIPVKALSIREAMLSPFEEIPARAGVGRIIFSPTVGCPPAVPILVCGEVISEAAAEVFSYYGTEHCNVIK